MNLKLKQILFGINILVFCFVKGAVIEREESVCDGLIINKVYHDVEVLKTGLDRPYMMVVDYSTNNLYFSYSLNKDDDVFKTARLDINTKEFADIDGVENGFAQTIDQENHHIYIGSSNGLFQYDHNYKTAESVGEKGTDVWMVYFNEILYYSTFPSQFLFTFINGQSVRFKDLEDTKVDDMVIDNEDDIFYTNATGLYKQKKGTKNAILVKEIKNNGVRRITSDINGNVYICMADGVYSVKKESNVLEKVVDIDDAFGLAFDNDNNIVYSDATQIVRLKPNREKVCESVEVTESVDLKTESPN